MGSTYIQGFMEMGTDLDTMLLIQLRSNHFPPLPSSLVPVCKEVIMNIENDDSGALVQLPDGISWKGQSTAPSYACANAWHLWDFIGLEDADVV